MMVGDDHIYPTLTGIDNPLMRLDPTVQGDDKGYFVVIGKVYPLSRNPITFPIPIWYIGKYMGVDSQEKQIQHGHRAGTIYIVISVDKYRLLLVYG